MQQRGCMRIGQATRHIAPFIIGAWKTAPSSALNNFLKKKRGRMPLLYRTRPVAFLGRKLN